MRSYLRFRTNKGLETVPAPDRAIELLPGQKLSSRTRAVSIELDGPVKIVGERINPTGKRKFAKELRKGMMEQVIREAREQEERGAHILDVNVGAPGVAEDLLMEEAIYSVNLNSTLPVMIDSVNPAVIERGLMAVDGIPIVNSVTGEMRKLEALLPLVKRFGASLICLLLDESGIPEAEKAGIDKNKLIVDCLATTISASQRAAIIALETVELVRKELDLPVILGVSNVSFGMPERQLINRTFLSMAVSRGLNLAIVNPHDREMIDTIFSCNLLWGKDTNISAV
jgi:5-methyltetrahydrofolate--homocysteine methyltransferase